MQHAWIRRKSQRRTHGIGSALLTAALLFAAASASLAAQERAWDPTAAVRVERDWTRLDASVRGLRNPASVFSLVDSLDQIADDEWGRVRAVWIWITEFIAYDTQAFFDGTTAALSPDDVFRVRSSVCEGYSALFVRLADGLGLDARVVSGYGKGAGYSAGQEFEQTNHAWTAVAVDGRWHLFDPTWGAGNVNGRSFVRDYDEVWFDTHPDLFLRTHLPEDPAWQLAERPVTRAEWEAEPLIPTYRYSGLFDLGYTDAQILSSLRSQEGLAVAYSNQGHPVTVVNAPLARTLPAGELFEVRLHAPGDYQASLVNNRDWTFLEREGDELVGVIRPIGGTLSINVRLDPRLPGYSTLIEYRVR